MAMTPTLQKAEDVLLFTKWLAELNEATTPGALDRLWLRATDQLTAPSDPMIADAIRAGFDVGVTAALRALGNRLLVEATEVKRDASG